MSSEERDRLAELIDAMDRKGGGNPPGAARQLMQIIDGGSFPTSVPRMFLANPADIDVDESEGETATVVADGTQAIPVLVLGPLPAAGDLVIATVVGGRWVAGSEVPAPTVVPLFCRGGSDVTICDVPTSLSFTDSIMGSCELTHIGSGVSSEWRGTLTYSYPGSTLASNGGNACPSRDVTISVRFFRSGLICVFNIACNLEDTVPGVTKCPIDGGFNSASGAGGGPSHVTCSPFHTSVTNDLSMAGQEVQAMYGFDTGTVTLTVTE